MLKICLLIVIFFFCIVLVALCRTVSWIRRQDSALLLSVHLCRIVPFVSFLFPRFVVAVLLFDVVCAMHCTLFIDKKKTHKQDMEK